MSFDFTSIIDRRQVTTEKWVHYDDDVLPLWVADMDLASPDVIQQALQVRTHHPIYGYAHPPASLNTALTTWSQTHYDWTIDTQWLHWLPGVVPALHVVAQALCAPDEALMTLTPIYPPFLSVGTHTGRETVTASLAEPSEQNGGRWTLDIDALEAAITPNTKVLLFCHPHNPTGRVFTQQELEALAAFVERHDLWVCSDELHCDLILNGEQHRPLAKAVPQIADRIITLWAASKTFNVAGLTCACAVISNPVLRARFAQGCAGWMPSHNVMGMVATEAAYTQGEPWRQALITHLQACVRLIETYVARWPGVQFIPPEATFLGWLDVRKTDLSASPQQFLLEKARVALSDGADFGNPGFVRINFGTTKAQLENALQRLDPWLSAKPSKR